MEPEGMLSLSVELLHNISQHLTVTDVLNCSQTCWYLRMSFNDNRVWRRFVPEKAVHLETQEKWVAPVSLHQVWKDTLTPLCSYRLHYMRFNHVLTNWKTGNITKYMRTLPLQIREPRGSTAKRHYVFYKERYFFVLCFQRREIMTRIECWDMGREPFLISVLSSTSRYDCNDFHIFDSNLVVYEGKKVSVYEINLPEKHIPLLYSFIVTGAEVVWSANGEVLQGESSDGAYYNIHQYLVFIESKINGSNNIHVWDIANATKVGVFALPVPSSSADVVYLEKNECLLRISRYNPHNYFLLNFNEKRISDTGLKCEKYPQKAFLYESHILTLNVVPGDKKELICSVYDLKKSKEVKKRCFFYCSSRIVVVKTLESNAIVNGSFILHDMESFHHINALTLETYHNIRCEYSPHPAQLHVFGPTFVLFRDKKKMLCVWDVRKNEEYRLNAADGAFIANDTMTKLVIHKNGKYGTHKMELLHFW